MNPTNPTRINLTQILTLRANPTQLNLILDPKGPIRPKNGSSQVQIEYIRYIIELNSNLILIEVNSTWLDPFLDPEGRSDSFEPKNWAQKSKSKWYKNNLNTTKT